MSTEKVAVDKQPVKIFDTWKREYQEGWLILLQEAVAEMGTQGKLEEELHWSGGMVSRYLSKERTPDDKRLVEIAEFLGIAEEKISREAMERYEVKVESGEQQAAKEWKMARERVAKADPLVGSLVQNFVDDAKGAVGSSKFLKPLVHLAERILVLFVYILLVAGAGRRAR